ncbi:MAG: hypothetical protein JSV68_24245 [Anaerolineaceae bacterium]|nr:MAG: hypothetical protein JSV68_24245 [Anaerolineaceae bacterium]
MIKHTGVYYQAEPYGAIDHNTFSSPYDGDGVGVVLAATGSLVLAGGS